MNSKRRALYGLLLLTLVASSPGICAEDATSADWEKVVFHLDDVANASWAMMLANSYLDDSPKAQIVFVTYGPGIDFLLHGAEDRRGNGFGPKVKKLTDRGVDFRICAATLGARGVPKERIVEQAVIVPSGIAELARLQIKEGYAYLKP